MTEERSALPPNPRGLINIAILVPGTRVRLRSGATAEVTTNPRDGMWLQVRYLGANGAPEGDMEMVFADEVVGRSE